MTEAELSQYISIKEEIKLLTSKITELGSKDAAIRVTDKVKGSSKYFPYVECNFNITGVDQDVYYRNQQRISSLKRKREEKRTELIEKESEMHDFIYSIPDSQVRQIFILRFMDGLTQEQISKRIHLDQSAVSRKIKSYLCE